MIEYALVLPGTYLLGSISWGLIVGKMTRGVDVREHGSGATGMSNVLRTVGPRLAVLVLILDISKGVIGVLLARLVIGSPVAEALAGFLVILGHNWPVFSGFKGGRGVTTGVGGLAVMSPIAAAIALGVFLSAIAASRYVSLGSVLAATTALLTMPIMVATSHADSAYLIYTFAGCLLILWRHVGNIQRLIHGTERRLWGEGTPPSQAPPKRGV